MTSVFISYRRSDTAGHARFIYERLASTLGYDRVFMDVDSTAIGADFADRLERTIASVDVAVVVIGPRWVEASDAQGHRRLDDPHDSLRMEISAAMHAGVRVVPVLVDGATMPSPHQLPEDIRPFAYRRALAFDPQNYVATMNLLASIGQVDRDDAEQQHQHADPSPYVPAEAEEQARHEAEEQARREGESDRISAPASGDDFYTVGQAGWSPPSQMEHLGFLLRRAVVHGVVPAGAPAVTTHDRPMSADPPSGGRPAPEPVAGWPEAYPSPVPAPGPPAGRSRSAGRFWLKLGAAAASLAVLYELARQAFGLFTLDSGPGQEPIGNAQGDVVDCTVFAPASVKPGESIMIQVFAHLAEQTEDARALATEFEPGAKRRAFRSLEAPVRRGSVLTFELHVPDAEIARSIETVTWRGRAESVQFEVALPHEPGSDLIGTVWVTLDGAPLGHVKFKLIVQPTTHPSPADLPVGEAAVRYTAAFVSYASADRDEVLRRVQMLQALRIPYFKDLLDLEPGDQWWPRLKSAIDQCDVFLLFWSSDAKRSEWVRKEVLHALQRKGGDELSPPEIRPVILQNQPIVTPWDELSHLHFNDRLLYFMSPSTTTQGAGTG